MPKSVTQWLEGVRSGTKSIRVVYVTGFNCYDVMVDGECAKRVFAGVEEACRRAEHARKLYEAERARYLTCPTCGRWVGTGLNGKIAPHKWPATVEDPARLCPSSRTEPPGAESETPGP